MKLFICEFITGGGLQNDEMSESMAREGDLMLGALIGDLQESGHTEIVCPRDARLACPAYEVQFIPRENNVWETWKKWMRQCEAAWLIAPESGNALYQLTTMAVEQNCMLFGCTPEAVKLATSKSETIRFLTSNNIACVPVLEYPYSNTGGNRGWVVKPDDGAGGEDSYFFEQADQLQAYVESSTGKNILVQEYMPGIPASISMLCHNGHCQLLSCNQQLFEFRGGRGKLEGIIVNGVQQYATEFRKLAETVAAVFTGLNGYVGIDLLITGEGLKVLEINPRLTTAYAGLKESLGLNPAAMIMNTLISGKFQDKPAENCRPVIINL